LADKFEEGKMGETSNTHQEKGNAYIFLVAKSKFFQT
jgi:hypothetical protein